MWRRLGRLAVVGLGLIAAGAVLVASSFAVPAERSMRLEGEERQVSAGAGDLGDIRAHNSPTLARNPRDPDHLVVTSRIDTPRFSCAVDVSRDGGRRWRRAAVPIPDGEEPKCYAADAAFGADGTLFVSYVTLRGQGNVPHAVWVTRSTDGGRSLRAPTRVAGELAFQVRLVADPRRSGRLYLTWLQADDVGLLRFAGPGNRIVVSRSEDGGRTWRARRPVSAPERQRVLAPVPAVGPAGDLYVLHLDVGQDRLDYEGGHEGFGGPPYAGRFALVLGRSADGGATWQEAVVDDRIVPVERFVAFLPAFPSLAVDRRSGRLFAAFHDGRHGRADVLLWSVDARDGEVRGPVRVNDTPRPDRTSQLLPKVAVAPDGRVDVVYYDRRADPGDRRNEVSLQSSFDGGRTFADRLRLSDRAFDSRIGFGSERGMPDLGSRLGLVSGDEGAVAVWPDTRHGTDASNKQDLLLAVASPERSLSPLADVLRQAGLALALGGLMALALAALRRSRRRLGASAT